ncbi:hypothetical protein ACIG87_19050 [Micromonospora sp. NPDC051925]
MRNSLGRQLSLSVVVTTALHWAGADPAGEQVAAVEGDYLHSRR